MHPFLNLPEWLIGHSFLFLFFFLEGGGAVSYSVVVVRIEWVFYSKFSPVLMFLPVYYGLYHTCIMKTMYYWRSDYVLLKNDYLCDVTQE